MVRSLALALLLVGSSACGVDDGPRLETIAPPSASAGERVVLTGARLCGDGRATEAGACDPLPPGRVSFGIDPQIDGAIVAWRDDQIDALVPMSAPIGDVLVVVTVDGRTSNGISFRVQ